MPQDFFSFSYLFPSITVHFSSLCPSSPPPLSNLISTTHNFHIIYQTPIGTEVGFSCLTFNLSRDGCKNEYLELNFKFDGQNAKYVCVEFWCVCKALCIYLCLLSVCMINRRKYCASDGPKNIIVPTNKVLLKYFHRDNDWCSQGFLCEVHTVGGELDRYIHQFVPHSITLCNFNLHCIL